MLDTITLFKKKTSPVDKFLTFTTFLVPLFLAISIFIADFLASLSGIILIYIFLTKKDLNFFKSIKKEVIFFFIFYLIIVLSFIFSEFKNISFLPSIFYFRYFLLSLSIFYLLKKYTFNINLLALSIFFTIGLVLFDATFQFFFKSNIFGYKLIGIDTLDPLIYLTSFFNEEKKLGSYTIRSLPLLLSLLFFIKPKKLPYLTISTILISGIIIYFSSERTALFLFFIFVFFYFLTSNKKKIFTILFLTVFIIIINSSERLKYKYISFTAEQIQLQNMFNQNYDENKIVRFYSEEHENLVYTAIKIFQNNIFFGNGVKSFYATCAKLNSKNNKINIINNSKRNNRIVCSTHPHSTYFQLLSDLGIFGFLMISFIFFYCLVLTLKFFFKKKTNRLYYEYAFYFINLSLIINLMPLIPSGNFFNNWLSLMIYFSLGIWLYLKNFNKIKNDSYTKKK